MRTRGIHTSVRLPIDARNIVDREAKRLGFSRAVVMTTIIREWAETRRLIEAENKPRKAKRGN